MDVKMKRIYRMTLAAAIACFVPAGLSITLLIVTDEWTFLYSGLDVIPPIVYFVTAIFLVLNAAFGIMGLVAARKPGDGTNEIAYGISCCVLLLINWFPDADILYVHLYKSLGDLSLYPLIFMRLVPGVLFIVSGILKRRDDKRLKHEACADV